MNYEVNKGDFVQVLVDCKGYSREEAEGVAHEYRNDLGAWIGDIGGDEDSLSEAKAFLKRTKWYLRNICRSILTLLFFIATTATATNNGFSLCSKS